jgi:hypothetical protein
LVLAFQCDVRKWGFVFYVEGPAEHLDTGNAGQRCGCLTPDDLNRLTALLNFPFEDVPGLSSNRGDADAERRYPDLPPRFGGVSSGA